MILRRCVLAAMLAMSLLLATGCQKNEYQPPTPSTVSVAQPLRQSVTNYLEETGTTEAVERVDIRARVTGFLEEVRFDPGTDVQRDDILYVIEQRPFKANVAAAKADLDAKEVELTRAEIELEREEQLFSENATSERSVVQAEAERDAARARVEEAKAALDRAQLDLDYTEVRTPIAGRVGKTLVKAGNLVEGTEATHLTTVIQYDPIYANFNISERSLLQIRDQSPQRKTDEIDKKDAKILLRRAGDKGFPFEGRFDYADLAVDQSTGTFMIRGIFPNPHLEIVPGLFVRVRIPIGVEKDALLIPERAIGSDQAGKYVFVVDSENRSQRRDVVVGVKHGNMVVIEEGLDGKEWVVTDGVQRSRPGAEVAPQRKELSMPEGKAETVETGEESPIEEEPVKP
ncbi:MAG TPA: efflux RND transporter periplasmic adaptor subunit [Thermoguttaceae bacterium]|nr:efflux RND transporter periplasmic adaptor subunit [Thermoguttaceae bacterium]